MEVHAHTHTPRKKWTHYFWEFLMLFLAVFCGFLAEYKLEHVIEHQREKQFIRSLIEDVELDTASLNQIMTLRNRRREMLDSLSVMINNPDRDKNMNRVYYFGRHIPRLFAISFTYNDRTIQQLKNSGNMRLIRNRAAADAIILYDAKVRGMSITEERETEFMFLCLPYLDKIFDGLVFDKMMDSLHNINEPPPGIRLLSTANAAIPNFNTSLHTVKSSNVANLQRLRVLIEDAKKLLLTLKKEYHLK